VALALGLVDELPVELNSCVRAVRARERGGYVVECDDRTYGADQIVIATEPFQTPRVPSIAKGVAGAVHQLHSSDYRRPQDIADGPGVVVGGGNTGVQMAYELAGTHEVHLLTATGLMGKTLDSRIGRRLSSRDALIGPSPRAIGRRGGHQISTHALLSTVPVPDECMALTPA
jgi:putative flavoprotein involved in K+ transport